MTQATRVKEVEQVEVHTRSLRGRWAVLGILVTAIATIALVTIVFAFQSGRM